jgi:hypothetical protein
MYPMLPQTRLNEKNISFKEQVEEKKSCDDARLDFDDGDEENNEIGDRFQI